MRFSIVLLSALLILAGLISISLSNVTVRLQFRSEPPRESVVLIKNFTYNWSPRIVPVCNFNVSLDEGDFVFLRITPPTAWGEFSCPSPTDDYPPIEGMKGPIFIYVDFNHTAEDGHVKSTMFEIVYYYDLKRMRLLLAPRSPIHVYLNVSETLLVDNPEDCGLIGGIVKFGGAYTIWISGPFEVYNPPGEHGTWPVYVGLYKYIGELSGKPYKQLLPVGASLLIFGAISLIWGFRSGARKVERKSKPPGRI
jgi:hypothetical protein